MNLKIKTLTSKKTKLKKIRLIEDGNYRGTIYIDYGYTKRISISRVAQKFFKVYKAE